MSEDQFWDHIRATRRRDCEAHCDRLGARLAKLPAAEILDFTHWWNVLSGKAYLRDLWGAAYLINGGCSDDGFEYFRSWLLMQGRAAFEAALDNPDSLAGVTGGEGELECECRADLDAYCAATRQKPGDAAYDAFNAAYHARHPQSPSLPELAGRWDFDDDAEVRRRLPRLAKMYLD